MSLRWDLSQLQVLIQQVSTTSQWGFEARLKNRHAKLLASSQVTRKLLRHSLNSAYVAAAERNVQNTT